MSLLDLAERLLERLRRAADDAREQASLLAARYLDRQATWIFAVVRRVRPIVSTRRFALVTRYDDVVEALGRNDRFRAAMYARNTEAVAGPFILGIDDVPFHRHEEEALRRAVRADDLPQLAELAADAAEERLAAAERDGRIDVVAGLVDPVTDGAIARYFGAPGPDPATQRRWARALFREILTNVNNDERVHQRAMAAAAEMRPHVDRLIAERKRAILAGGDQRDDVLGRLLRIQDSEPSLDDMGIRRNLMGLISAWIPTVSRAMALAMDDLLRRPRELAEAQRAARRGERDLVGAHIFEALRFKPQTPGVPRTCVADHPLAAGTRRGATIRAGAMVFIATRSAMMDPRVVERPREFRLDRPWSHYLHFGDGLHRCFGESIIRVQMPEMAMALLRRPELRRAPGRAGKVSWEELHPVGLTVEFEPA